MRYPSVGVLAAILVWAGLTVSAIAQPAANTIGEIRVEGTQRIEVETVRSYLTVDVGSPFDPLTLDDSLRSLFQTGLFADVNLIREGDALVVQVVENPIINRIAFEGNRRIDDDVLNAEVQLRPRVVYTRTRVQSDVQRILDLYRRGGRFAATVEPKVIQLDQNRVDLVFEIDEGELTSIQRVSFIGNERFSDARLREEVQTKETRWYRFFSDADRYDPDKLAFDRELLRRLYLNAGYADFRVTSAVAELTPERDGFYITFTLEEGERYRFGTLDVTTQLPDVDPEDLRNEITVSEGDWYNAEEVENTIDNLVDRVGALGYAFVDVRPRIVRDGENLLINVVFELEEGPRVYVERIDIVGNLRTVDQVIRREFQLVEGDAFNTARIRRSQQNIRDLDFFQRVDVTQEPGSAPDRTVITVAVEEKSTGELSIGAGYSTTVGPIVDFSVRERNLLGRGQDLRFGAMMGTRGQEFDIGFTEPYFLDRPLAAGFDLFHMTSDRQRESGYDLRRSGGTLRAGYQLTESLRHTVRYTLSQDEVSNVDANASRLVRESEGQRLTSMVGQTLLYDRRDSRLMPSDGYFVQMSNDVAGLGGDVSYFRTRVAGGNYWPIGRDMTLGVLGEVGGIVGLGEDVRLNDRFFLGGDDLRGFARGGVGPRDLRTDDALGGNYMYSATAELSFPIGLPDELGFRGHAFTDAGAVTRIDGSRVDVGDSGAPRVSVGAGVSWQSPFGPVRLDLTQAVVKETYDKTELFRFSFGTRF